MFFKIKLLVLTWANSDDKIILISKEIVNFPGKWGGCYREHRATGVDATRNTEPHVKEPHVAPGQMNITGLDLGRKVKKQ